MSYDLSLQIDTGGTEPAYLDMRAENITYNLGPMLRLVLHKDGLRALDGMLGSEVIPLVSAALARMAAAPTECKAIEAPNGWGTYEQCFQWLIDLKEDCEQHPKARLGVT